MKFKQQIVQCLGPSGLHRMAYTEWGARDNPRVLICVHGLTRNGRDFDALAEAMSGHYRVICPDVVGRGQSSHLRDPAAYGIPQYVADMVTLIARLNVETVHWVGTSMGGLIGMALAIQPETPIRKLVLNDVGPVITAVSLERIGMYLGRTPRFDSIEQVESAVRFVSQPFGTLTDAQWRHLTVHVTRQAADGKFEFAYDPGIAEPFKEVYAACGGKDIESWPLYDAISCPTLLVRGANSDLLTAGSAHEMTRRGPKASLVEVPDVGHAPMLLDDAQVGPVREFLLA